MANAYAALDADVEPLVGNKARHPFYFTTTTLTGTGAAQTLVSLLPMRGDAYVAFSRIVLFTDAVGGLSGTTGVTVRLRDLASDRAYSSAPIKALQLAGVAGIPNLLPRVILLNPSSVLEVTLADDGLTLGATEVVRLTFHGEKLYTRESLPRPLTKEWFQYALRFTSAGAVAANGVLSASVLIQEGSTFEVRKLILDPTLDASLLAAPECRVQVYEDRDAFFWMNTYTDVQNVFGDYVTGFGPLHLPTSRVIRGGTQVTMDLLFPQGTGAAVDITLVLDGVRTYDAEGTWSH